MREAVSEAGTEAVREGGREGACDKWNSWPTVIVEGGGLGALGLW